MIENEKWFDWIHRENPNAMLSADTPVQILRCAVYGIWDGEAWWEDGQGVVINSASRNVIVAQMHNLANNGEPQEKLLLAEIGEDGQPILLN